jgi:phosphate transport system protein
MASTPRIRSVLDQDIEAIRDDILRMGSFVREQVTTAVRSLKSRDIGLAHQVLSIEQQINDMRYKVELASMRSIATQQPTAKDLRTIIASMHIASELERIADHAAGIASTTIRIGDEPLVKPLIDIPRMQEIACEMLHDALDAYVKKDAEAAKLVAQRDWEVDELYDQILRELLTYMMQDARVVTQSTYLLWIAHDLERIADRITNICERVIFIATAELGDYKPEKE